MPLGANHDCLYMKIKLYRVNPRIVVNLKNSLEHIYPKTERNIFTIIYKAYDPSLGKIMFQKLAIDRPSWEEIPIGLLQDIRVVASILYNLIGALP